MHVRRGYGILVNSKLITEIWLKQFLLHVLIINVVYPEIVRVDNGGDHEHFPLNSISELQRHRRLRWVVLKGRRRCPRIQLLSATSEYRCLILIIWRGIYLLNTRWRCFLVQTMRLCFKLNNAKIKIYLIIWYKCIIFFEALLRAVDAVEVDLAKGVGCPAGGVEQVTNNSLRQLLRVKRKQYHLKIGLHFSKRVHALVS